MRMAQQQAAMQQMMMPQRMPNPMKGSSIFRLFSFAENLSGYSVRP